MNWDDTCNPVGLSNAAPETVGWVMECRLLELSSVEVGEKFLACISPSCTMGVPNYDAPIIVSR